MPAGIPLTRVLKTAKVKITTKCNRSCDFCIFANGAQGENMTPEVFSTILDRLESIPFRQLHINGGEPTVHRGFPALSRLARTRLPDKVMVLGTNAITLARNQRLMNATLHSYDQILIGCDDEHGNYAEVHAVVPVLRAAGKTVVVNSVLEGISEERLAGLADLCTAHGAVHVTNHVHHIDVGQPANDLHGLCARYLDQHLMIELDGSCYRCFNAMAKEDSEFSVWDEDFAAKVFAPRRHHYRFCGKCHEYTDSGSPAVPAVHLAPASVG
ncbi:radical SAM protein [Planomonospora sp. ID82291]|uniref:radical SAM protein n=1 Tax=Planomonospora sp. ID82291 TaxID=2738136 RepID=UPI0018C3A842|nr:radical SAM protein [Planomonospora sp. ID82291]MBG0818683.1 radical SAM protein [Planomonospora sp. ID82291]